MANIISLENSTVTINGTIISGFSDDEDSFTIPSITIAVVKRGADGKMTGTSTGDKGGLVEIKLLTTSNSVKFLSTLSEQQKKGATVVIKANILNHDTGASGEFNNGIITTYHPFPSLGKGGVSNMEYGIEFESINGSFTSANFG